MPWTFEPGAGPSPRTHPSFMFPSSLVRRTGLRS